MLSLFTVDVFGGTVVPMILKSGSENGKSRLNEPISDIYQIGRKGNSSAPIKNFDGMFGVICSDVVWQSVNRNGLEPLTLQPNL